MKKRHDERSVSGRSSASSYAAQLYTTLGTTWQNNLRIFRCPSPPFIVGDVLVYL